MECGQIVTGLVAAQCGKAETAGTGAKVILLNYADIDRIKSTVTGNVISAIVMNTGKKGVLLQTRDNSTVGQSTLERGTYISTYTHTVDLKVFTRNQETKDFMTNLADSRVVAIVENHSIGAKGEVKYEVYGWQSGLICSALPWTTEFADTVTYAATLNSDDKSKESGLPLSFFSTDLTATETALAALYTAVK